MERNKKYFEKQHVHYCVYLKDKINFFEIFSDRVSSVEKVWKIVDFSLLGKSCNLVLILIFDVIFKVLLQKTPS